MEHLGLNYYFRQVVTDDPDGPPPRARMVTVPDAVRTAMDWEVHPDGLEQLLHPTAPRSTGCRGCS